MIEIILVEPENPGNVGAVARVMKNFGFDSLVLINPKINHLCTEARNRAKHAQDVLEKAIVTDWSHVKQLDLKVATTARVGTVYNINRASLTPHELRDKLNKGKIGLIFGREGTGLLNKEIAECDFTVTIPTAKYGSLNLSHAVAVMLYEISKGQHAKKGSVPASPKEKEVLFSLIDDAVNKMGFGTKEKMDTQIKTWKRVIGKSMLTKREFFVLAGFFRKLR
jgi:tRNA/rRNA methyltransferase